MAIQPVEPSQTGWRMRERGLPCRSTVVTLHQTMRFTRSLNCSAISSKEPTSIHCLQRSRRARDVLRYALILWRGTSGCRSTPWGRRFPSSTRAPSSRPRRTVVGDVRIEAGASIWYGAVVRGDTSYAVIGEGANIQDGAVVHGRAGVPALIGEEASIAHNAVIHGATIGAAGADRERRAGARRGGRGGGGAGGGGVGGAGGDRHPGGDAGGGYAGGGKALHRGGRLRRSGWRTIRGGTRVLPPNISPG